MTLPNVHMPNKEQWQRLHDSAATNDGKAIVGALMLVSSDLLVLHDILGALEQPPSERERE